MKKRSHVDANPSSSASREQDDDDSKPDDSEVSSKKKPGQPQFEARAFCFTSYAYTADTYDDWRETLRNKLNAARGYGYLVANPEICPTTGRFHIQGYVQTLRSEKKASTVQNLLGDKKCKMLKAAGDAASNRVYCTKQESRAPGLVYFEWGKMNELRGTSGGAPTTLQVVGRDIVDGKRSVFEISKEHPDVFMRHCNGMKALAAMHAPKRASGVKINLAVFCGVAGGGKSTESEKWCEQFGKPIFRKLKGKNWDGYAGEETVLFEEFGSDEGWTATEFNALIQAGPHKVNARYIAHEMMATNFAFNSNEHPNEWFPGATEGQMAGVYRRIAAGTYYKYTVPRPGQGFKFKDLKPVERHPDKEFVPCPEKAIEPLRLEYKPDVMQLYLGNRIIK